MFFRFSSIRRKSKLLEMRSEIGGVAPLVGVGHIPLPHWSGPSGHALRKLTIKEGKSMNRTECSRGEL